MPIPIETVVTDSFSMRYFRFGSGETPFVILPGLSVQSVMLSAKEVAQAYEKTARRFTVYVFDRREELPPVYSISEMAKDTVTAMRTLGLKDIRLFGASQGGMIALLSASMAPDLVKALVIGSSTPKMGKGSGKKILEWVELAKEGKAEELYLSFGEAIYPPAMFANIRHALLNAADTVTKEELSRFVILASTIDDYNALPVLKKIICPTLVLGSEDDAIVGSEASWEIYNGLTGSPKASIYLYNGYGHASFDSAPDYQDRILDFLEDAGCLPGSDA